MEKLIAILQAEVKQHILRQLFIILVKARINLYPRNMIAALVMTSSPGDLFLWIFLISDLTLPGVVKIFDL